MASWAPLVLISTLLLAACAGETPPSSAAPPIVETGATITGRVVLDGMAPRGDIIRLDGDPKCVDLQMGQSRRTESIVVGEGQALQNVFVYVKDGLRGYSFPVPTDPVVLDQQRCWYVPRVLGIQVGQPLTIRNSDPLLHNVRSESDINEPFNLGQPVQGMTTTRVFTTREVMVPIRCDVHRWMSAYIGVLEHPYFAVTGPDGAFALPDLPPGTYAIEAWHERLGTRTAEVTLGPDDTEAIVFSFTTP